MTTLFKEVPWTAPAQAPARDEGAATKVASTSGTRNRQEPIYADASASLAFGTSGGEDSLGDRVARIARLGRWMKNKITAPFMKP